MESKYVWAFVGVMVVAGIYLFYKGYGSDSGIANTVVPAPDNSGAVNAQAQVQGAQISAEANLLNSFIGFKTTEANNAAAVTAAQINANAATTQTQIQANVQNNSINQAAGVQKHSDWTKAIGAIASAAAFAWVFCYKDTDYQERFYVPYDHGGVEAVA